MVIPNWLIGALIVAVLALLSSPTSRQQIGTVGWEASHNRDGWLWGLALIAVALLCLYFHPAR
jgi:hypothetical protein